MAVDREGQRVWEEDQIYDGIRQDATESIRRYRIVRNFNFRNIGALTKDLGIRKIHQTAVSSTYPARAALDCHFNNGTQKLVFIQGISGGSNIFVYNTTTNELGAAAAPTIANVDHPDMLMFADKLYVIDGTTLRAMDSSETITTPGESDYSNPCRFGVVYGNRLILSGNSTYPFSFFSSGIRNAAEWDVDLSVDVTGLHGDAIECLGVCGPYMIVGGPKFTRAYYLGTASPGDWDWDELSHDVGPINHASYKAVSRNGEVYGFFWSEEGPMVLHQSGEGLPRLFPLWKPIDKMVRGVAHQGMPALTVAKYSKITTEYVHEYNEVRFACVETTTGNPQYSTGSEPNALMCVDLDSVTDYVRNPSGSWPKWRLRDNVSSDLQCERIFVCRIDPATGFPSLTGQNRLMCAASGQIYEMDARDTYTDAPNGASILAHLRKDGYDGLPDGVREHTKSVRRWHVRTNQSGDYSLYARLYTDGGQQSSETSVPLGEGLSLWGSDLADGAWGDGSIWNEGEFVVKRGGFSGVGKKFDLEIYDSGNVVEELQINSWSLSGMLEDRR
jgi:hypothetical protein